MASQILQHSTSTARGYAHNSNMTRARDPRSRSPKWSCEFGLARVPRCPRCSACLASSGLALRGARRAVRGCGTRKGSRGLDSTLGARRGPRPRERPQLPDPSRRRSDLDRACARRGRQLHPLRGRPRRISGVGRCPLRGHLQPAGTGCVEPRRTASRASGAGAVEGRPTGPDQREGTRSRGVHGGLSPGVPGVGAVPSPRSTTSDSRSSAVARAPSCRASTSSARTSCGSGSRPPCSAWGRTPRSSRGRSRSECVRGQPRRRSCVFAMHVPAVRAMHRTLGGTRLLVRPRSGTHPSPPCRRRRWR